MRITLIKFNFTPYSQIGIGGWRRGGLEQESQSSEYLYDKVLYNSIDLSSFWHLEFPDQLS